MKRNLLTIAFALLSILSFAQKGVSGFTRNEDLKTGTTRIQTTPEPLAPGLTYVLVKEIHLGKTTDIDYSLKITMDKSYTKTLNSELKTDIEFGNGEFDAERETKENIGWFDGTFTLPIEKLQRAKQFGMVHFIIKGEKIQIFCIDEITNEKYKNNLTALVNTSI
jgi:hypothetical protein